ncbi:PIN domain-containing protein [Thiomonas sp.]
MSVLFDTSVLLLAIFPNARPPIDPSTGSLVEYPKQRVDYLIRKLSKTRKRVLIPSPVLSELLVYAGKAANEYVQKLQEPPFRIVPFDTRAAIECADAMHRHGLKGKGKDNPRAKVKFDRQIIAIAQVERVEAIYSDDSDIFSYGAQAGIQVIRSHELELDPEDRQHKLALSADDTLEDAPP